MTTVKVTRLVCHYPNKEAINGGDAYGVGANCPDIPRVTREVSGGAEENTCLLVYGKQLRMCIELSWTADRRLTLHVQH